MSTTERSTGTIYQQMQVSPEFIALRSRFRRFVFPMSAAFLLWYLLYVLLASFAPAFMSIKVFGNINVGLLVGLGQFVSTFLIATLYTRFAERHIDPAAERIRRRIEGDA